MGQRSLIAQFFGGTGVDDASTAARREAALADGADHVVDYTRPGWEDEARALTGSRGVEVTLHLGGDDTAPPSACRVRAVGWRLAVRGLDVVSSARRGGARVDQFADGRYWCRVPSALPREIKGGAITGAAAGS